MCPINAIKVHSAHGTSQSRLVAHWDQVAAFGRNDVLRTARPGGDHRESASHRLDEGDPKRLEIAGGHAAMRSCKGVHHAIRISGSVEGNPMALIHRAHQTLQSRALPPFTDDFKCHEFCLRKRTMERSNQ